MRPKMGINYAIKKSGLVQQCAGELFFPSQNKAVKTRFQFSAFQTELISTDGIFPENLFSLGIIDQQLIDFGACIGEVKLCFTPEWIGNYPASQLTIL